MMKIKNDIEKMNKAGVLIMRSKKMVFVVLAGLLLSACEGDKSTTLQDSLTLNNTVDTISNYDLGESIIPFPNDFLFAANEAVPVSDGTLNIPVEDLNDLSDPKVAMNGGDGFSTVAPMSTGFTGAIDEASISGESVRVYPVTKGGGLAGPATAVGTPLVFGVDYIAALSSVDATNSTLVILPLKPLLPKSSYAVVITNELKSASGRRVGTSGSYLLTRGEADLYDLAVDPNPAIVPPSTVEDINNAIKNAVLKPAPDATDEEIIEAGVSAARLETIRLNIVKPTEDAIIAADTSLVSADIILHWTFTTQSTTDVLAQVRTDIRGGAVPATVVLPTAVAQSPNDGVAGFVGADVYVGSLDVPYYLTVSSTVNSPSNDPTALGSSWRGPSNTFLTYLAANLSPQQTSAESIPVMVSIPKAYPACPGGVKPANWPVVIYQHGITTSRGTMFAVADALANACFAVVAIDMPMHGITGEEGLPYSALKDIGPGGPGTVTERTFDLDLVTQDEDDNIIAEEPDGIIDTSGRYFVNLTNLQNTRDNVRQAVSDLFALTYALQNMDVAGDTFDVSRIYFLGHSLGAMAGAVFTALEPDVRDVVFAFGGASLPKILDGSAAFGPTIAAGLAVNGVIKGTADYEAFLGAAQTVVDSADPVNFTPLTLAASTPAVPVIDRGILFFEIVGGNSSPSDLVVPNTVPDGNDSTGTVPALLAGTEPLLKLLGLSQQNATIPGDGTTNLRVSTKYISGEHSSLLDPTPDPAVTTEIQTQTANFFGSDGTALVVTDDTVLQAPPSP